MNIQERNVKIIRDTDLMEFAFMKMGLKKRPNICDSPNDTDYYYELVNPKGLTADEILELKAELDKGDINPFEVENLLKFLIEQRHLVVGCYLVRVSW